MLLMLAAVSLPVLGKGRQEPSGEERSADTVSINGKSPANTGAPSFPDPGGPGLSIESAVEAALEHSTELELERLNLQKSAAAVKEARAASGPSLSLQTSGSVLSNPQEGFKISKGAFGYAPTIQSTTPVALPDSDYVLIEDAEHTFFRITATLTQPLFTWGKLQKAVSIAGIDFDVAVEQFSATERSVEKQVRLAYYGLLFAEKTESILSEAETIAGLILEDKEEAFDGGIITRQEVLEAASNKAALSAQLARTLEAGSTARLSLLLLTGIDMKEIQLTDDFRREEPDFNESDLLTDAFGASAMRGELFRRVEQAEELLAIESASRPLRPDLSLNLTVDVTGQKIPLVHTNWTESWDTNVILTVGTLTNLFDSGASESKIEQARTSLETARQGLHGFETQLELHVRSCVETVKTSWAEMVQAEAELMLAEEMARNAAVSYENELITRAELQGARLARLAAELSCLRALYVYQTALIELETLT